MSKFSSQEGTLAPPSKLDNLGLATQLSTDKPSRHSGDCCLPTLLGTGALTTTDLLKDKSPQACKHVTTIAALNSKVLKYTCVVHRGATIKSLTLAADIQAKKATYAVTCETLKHLPVLERVVEETGILGLHERLGKEEAYVLCYEVLFGEGVRPHGPAERAILKQKEALQAAFNELEQNGGLAGRLLCWPPPKRTR